MRKVFKLTSLLLASVLTVGSASALTASAAAMPDPQSRFIIGDVNSDGKVNISDVTEIQRWLANAKELGDTALDAADADQNGEVKIGDATLIQNYCADVYRKDSVCGHAKKDGRVLDVYTYKITDSLGWGNFTAVALDSHGSILTDVKHNYPGKALLGDPEYDLLVPEDISSLYIVSEDGQKRTKAIKGLNQKSSRSYQIYNNNPGGEPEYILYDTEPHWVNPGVYGSFRFINSLFWNEVYVYAYNSDGTVGAEWPGEKLENPQIDNYGEEVFTVNAVEGADGFIIHNNAGKQTDIITDTTQAYYLIEDKTTTDSYGNRVYIPFVAEDHDYPEPDSSFKFYNTLGWNDIYIYQFNNQGTVGAEWPGKKLTEFEYSDYGYETYTVYFENGVEGCVINNGAGQQTDNIYGGAPGYYLLESEQNVNEFGTSVYIPLTYEKLNPAVAPRFKFANSLKWNEVYMFSCDGEGKAIGGDFPGTKLTDRETNDDGIDIYNVKVPKGAQVVYFSDGKEAQTVAISNFSPEGGKYSLSSDFTITDSDGKVRYQPLENGWSLGITFLNSLGWDKVYAYSYDENCSYSGEWPGVELKPESTTDFGQEIYRISDFYQGAEYIILSDGEGHQTLPIECSNDGRSVYLIEEMTEVDEYGVTGYIPQYFPDL